MFDFENLSVYSKAKHLNKEINNILQNVKADSFMLEQLKRASLSVVLNIAEGSGRYSKADKRHFYVMSRGSVYECASLISIFHENGIISKSTFNKLYFKQEEISKMLLGLINSQR